MYQNEAALRQACVDRVRAAKADEIVDKAREDGSLDDAINTCIEETG